MKIRLDLAYDGTGFKGWARQRGEERTAEGELLQVLGQVVGRVQLSAAGRTDAGVHARQQVVTFDSLHANVDPARVQAAVNGLLGPEMVAWRACRVPDAFDARYSATAREYRYRMCTGPVPDPFEARFVWHRPEVFDLRVMRDAAQALSGTRDFAAFCRRRPGGGSTVRTLTRLSIMRKADRLEFTVTADGFLHQMVRSLVGTLLEVGRGRADRAAVQELLTLRERRPMGNLPPGHGLTLERVTYGRHPA